MTTACKRKLETDLDAPNHRTKHVVKIVYHKIGGQQSGPSHLFRMTTACKRKLETDLDAPNHRTKHVQLSEVCATPNTATQSSVARGNRGRRRRKPSITYKSRHSRYKYTKTDNIAKHTPLEPINDNCNDLTTTPEDKRASSVISYTDSLLLTTEADSSALYKESSRSNSRALLSAIEECPSAFILKTPTNSACTPQKSSLRKNVGIRPLKDSPLTPKVTFGQYVTVAEFSPDRSTGDEECSNEQESVDDMFSIAVKHHFEQ